MLAEVTQEHRQGRRLLISTTQLDAQRLVIWERGATAASGHPQALDGSAPSSPSQGRKMISW